MGLIRYLVTLVVFLTLTKSIGVAISVDSYNAYEQLQQALLKGNVSSIPYLVVLADTFFPKQRSEPLCALIEYKVEDSLSGEVYSHSFLWTRTYLPLTTALLLFSFSKSGITLRGFEWEKSCLFANETELLLQPGSFNYTNDLIIDTLGDLTAELKAYAEARGIPKVSSSYRGFAIHWDSSRGKLHITDIVFTVYIVLLNIFIVCCSLASSNFLYKRLVKNIEGKTNPGYALFWAVVFLSIVWNVGPSWLVLVRYDYKVYCSLAIVIPLQLLVALLVKKSPQFPIPGSWYNTNHQCVGNIHSLSREICRCARCVFSHGVQVLSIWSLLIMFTFFVHYLTSVIVALYLDPLTSVVKLAFVKAILLCFIITSALIFAVDSFRCGLNKAALRKDSVSLVSVVTIVAALPILCFFLYLIGGIVFNNTSQSNNLMSIFTLIPSLLLIFASWFGHGYLFPKGETENGNALEESEQDLEGDVPKEPSDAAAASKRSVQTTGEATPLLPR